jgi:hypothetical protein
MGLSIESSDEKTNWMNQTFISQKDSKIMGTGGEWRRPSSFQDSHKAKQATNIRGTANFSPEIRLKSKRDCCPLCSLC